MRNIIQKKIISSKKENVSEYEKLIPVQQLFIQLQKLNRRYRLFTQGKNVLDLGCGEGRNTKYISDQGASVAGIDICKEGIKNAKKKYPKIKFYAADILRFKNKELYDLVFSQMVICNVKREGEIKKIFSKIYSLLNDGGRFFLSNADINTHFLNGNFIKHTFRSPIKNGDAIQVQLLREDGSYSKPWINYEWKEEKLVKLLKDSGFKEIITNNSMRKKGYYFIIAKKNEKKSKAI